MLAGGFAVVALYVLRFLGLPTHLLSPTALPQAELVRAVAAAERDTAERDTAQAAANSGGGGGTCCVCLAAAPAWGFAHSGTVHACLCAGCLAQLQSRGGLRRCPLCQQRASAVVRVVLS